MTTKTTRSKALLLIALAGVLLAAGGRYLQHRRLARERLRIANYIEPPRPIFRGQDDTLRQRSERRRSRASAYREVAAQLESGGAMEKPKRKPEEQPRQAPQEQPRPPVRETPKPKPKQQT